MKRIDSPKNEIIKQARKLHLSKERKKAGVFLIEGPKLFSEAVNAGLKVRRLFILEKLLGTIELVADEVFLVSERVIESLAETESPQGLVAVIEEPEKQVYDDKLVVFLDRIQDPGNLGTIIRTARAFGIGNLYLSPGTVDPFNDKTVRASAGAIFHLPCLYVFDTETWLKNQGKQIAVTVPSGGTAIKEYDFSKPTVLVIGNEGSGVSDLKDEYSKISIPMPGGTESLNAAIATAIVLYEATACH